MPFRLSTIFCLTVYLIERTLPAQRKESMLCNPLFKGLKPIARMIRIPKEFCVFEPFVLIHTLVPLRLVRFPVLIEGGIIAVPPEGPCLVVALLT